MGMLGFGSKLNQTVKKFIAGIPFSVQGNHVVTMHIFQGLTSGTFKDYTVNNFFNEDGNGEDRSPIPFDGKILYTKVRGRFNRSITGYIVPLINGVEQTDHKIDFSNYSAGDEWTATTEIDFSAGQYLGLRIKSTSGAFSRDEFDLMTVYGFDIT